MIKGADKQRRAHRDLKRGDSKLRRTQKVYREPMTRREPATHERYGDELILDLHGCDSAKFNRRDIQRYFEQLCELIEMERCDLHFWDDVGVDEDECQAHPKTKGTSAVQFILTSTIVIHTLDLMNTVYVNIFSCKDYDTDEAARFTAKWFESSNWKSTVIARN